MTKVVLRFGISSLASIHQPGDCVHLMWKIGRHGLAIRPSMRGGSVGQGAGEVLPPVGNNQCVQEEQSSCMRRHRNYTGSTRCRIPTDVRQAGSLGIGEPIELLLRAIFTRWPTTTIEQRWCFCWGGSGVRSRSRRQSAGARPEGYCTELFEELVEGNSFRELPVK